MHIDPVLSGFLNNITDLHVTLLEMCLYALKKLVKKKPLYTLVLSG